MSTIATQLASLNQGNQFIANVAAGSTEEKPNFEKDQYINSHGYEGYRGNHISNRYHLGKRNLETFSYANNKNVLNPSLGFNTQKDKRKPFFEHLVGTFVTESNKRMRMTESRLGSLELPMTNMDVTMNSLEVQMCQLTTAVNSQPSGTSSTNNACQNLKEVNEIFVQHVETEVVVEQENLYFSRGSRGKKVKEKVKFLTLISTCFLSPAIFALEC